jgi:hypothetical protein
MRKSTMTTAPQAFASEDRLRELAYAIWLEEGRPDGRAEAHWFEAVRRATTEPVTAPKVRKTTVRKVTVRKH